MLKKDIINDVSTQLNLPKADVEVGLNVMLDSMTASLNENRRVELRGFGSFTLRKRKPRNTKNPKTGVPMNIPERKTLHFTMSKSLKEQLIDK